MGNLIKKCFKLFIVCMMCVSVVACGARNKDYSEISQILKENDYEFEVMVDCSYAYVKKVIMYMECWKEVKTYFI